MPLHFARMPLPSTKLAYEKFSDRNLRGYRTCALFSHLGGTTNIVAYFVNSEEMKNC